MAHKDPHKRLKLNEHVVCEDFICGDFTKWCSNYGRSQKASCLRALVMDSHWGWRNGGWFVGCPTWLLVPAHWPSDHVSVRDIWSHRHWHRRYGTVLPEPQVLWATAPAQFQGIILNTYLQEATSFQVQLQCCTTYEVELKFPQDIRGRVAARFREITKKK